MREGDERIERKVDAILRRLAEIDRQLLRTGAAVRKAPR
jgi:hypothetical protein